MLPLIAPGLTPCTGGISVSFIKTNLLYIDTKWSVWEIWPTHLIGSNLWFFYVFESWDSYTFPLRMYYILNIKTNCFHVCAYQRSPQALAATCRSLYICDNFTGAPCGIEWVFFAEIYLVITRSLMSVILISNYSRDKYTWYLLLYQVVLWTIRKPYIFKIKGNNLSSWN